MTHQDNKKLGMGAGAEAGKHIQVPVEALEGAANQQKQDQQVPIDGFQQVVEMLRIADPAFRESLLKRLAMRDRELARSLRKDLGI